MLAVCSEGRPLSFSMCIMFILRPTICFCFLPVLNVTVEGFLFGKECVMPSAGKNATEGYFVILNSNETAF